MNVGTFEKVLPLLNLWIFMNMFTFGEAINLMEVHIASMQCCIVKSRILFVLFLGRNNHRLQTAAVAPINMCVTRRAARHESPRPFSMCATATTVLLEYCNNLYETM